MMEPAVRIKTNRQGFCRRHYEKLLQKGNRLGLALILDSHLNEIQKEMKGGTSDLFKGPGASATERIRKLERDCYLCSRIDFSFGKVMENAVLLWEKEPIFRKKAENQPYFCLSHFEEYLRNAKGILSKKDYALFYQQISAPTFRYFEELSQIPRGSGNEAGVADWLCAFADAHGLFCYRDTYHNVLIRKAASAGREKDPALLLQGHTDMVCEKNAATEHDFTKDPLRLAVKGVFI